MSSPSRLHAALIPDFAPWFL